MPSDLPPIGTIFIYLGAENAMRVVQAFLGNEAVHAGYIHQESGQWVVEPMTSGTCPKRMIGDIVTKLEPNELENAVSRGMRK